MDKRAAYSKVQTLSKSLPLFSSKPGQVVLLGSGPSPVHWLCVCSVPTPAQRWEGRQEVKGQLCWHQGMPSKGSVQGREEEQHPDGQSHSMSIAVQTAHGAQSGSLLSQGYNKLHNSSRATKNNTTAANWVGSHVFHEHDNMETHSLHSVSLSLKVDIQQQAARCTILQESGIDLLHCSTELGQIAKTIQPKSQPGFVLLWKEASLLLERKPAQYTHISGHTGILWH